MAVDSLVDLVVRNVDDGSWGTAAQVVVVHRGRTVLQLAHGRDALGRAVDDASMFPIYCAGKPLAALAMAVLVDQGEVSLDDRLDDILAEGLHPETGRLTIGMLLQHLAMLHYPPTAFLMNSPSVRDSLVRRVKPRGPIGGGRVAYSEYVSWHLLGWIIEALSGQAPDVFIDRHVLNPLAIGDSCTFRFAGGARAERLRINWDLSDPARRLPLLWEARGATMSDLRIASGAHASMVALGVLYEHLREIRQGRTGGVCEPATLRQFLTCLPPSHDPVLGRVVEHAHGFMVNGPHHGLWGMREDSFGHVGLGGMTFAFAQDDLTIAVHTNALTNVRSANPLDRRRLITETLFGRT